MIKGLQPPAANASALKTEAATRALNSEEVTLTPQPLRAQSEATLVVDVQLPAGYHLNADAPQRYQIVVEDGGGALALGKDRVGASASGRFSELPLRVPLRVAGARAPASLRISLTIYYCREDNTGTCRIKTLFWRAPVEITGQQTAPVEIRVRGEIKL
jgi:hypothetical protein